MIIEVPFPVFKINTEKYSLERICKSKLDLEYIVKNSQGK